MVYVTAAPAFEEGVVIVVFYDALLVVHVACGNYDLESFSHFLSCVLGRDLF